MQIPSESEYVFPLGDFCRYHNNKIVKTTTAERSKLTGWMNVSCLYRMSQVCCHIGIKGLIITAWAWYIHALDTFSSQPPQCLYVTCSVLYNDFKLMITHFHFLNGLKYLTSKHDPLWNIALTRWVNIFADLLWGPAYYEWIWALRLKTAFSQLYMLALCTKHHWLMIITVSQSNLMLIKYIYI